MGNAHDLHRVEFLVDAHHADLRGDRRARTAGDEDCGQHGAEFAYQRNAQDVDDERFGAELAQLQGHQIGQHHADQETDQCRDRQRGRAHAVEMARHIAPGSTLRTAQHAHEIQQQLAYQFHQLLEVAAARKHQHAQLIDLLQRVPGGRGRLFALAVLFDMREDFALGVADLALRRPLSAPMAPEDLRAHIVETRHAGQIPDGGAGHGLQLALQSAPLRAVGKARGCPVARCQGAARGGGIERNRRGKRRRHQKSVAAKWKPGRSATGGIQFCTLRKPRRAGRDLVVHSSASGWAVEAKRPACSSAPRAFPIDRGLSIRTMGLSLSNPAPSNPDP